MSWSGQKLKGKNENNSRSIAKGGRESVSFAYTCNSPLTPLGNLPWVRGVILATTSPPPRVWVSEGLRLGTRRRDAVVLLIDVASAEKKTSRCFCHNEGKGCHGYRGKSCDTHNYHMIDIDVPSPMPSGCVIFFLSSPPPPFPLPREQLVSRRPSPLF